MDDVSGGPAEVIQDDSTRPRVYLIFLLLTAIVLPVWWYTTSVPRAALSFPTWTSPRRLPRHTTLRVFMVDVRAEAWQDLGDLRVSPMARRDEEVEFEDTIAVAFKSMRTAAVDYAGKSVAEVAERLADGLGSSEAGQYDLFVIEPAIGDQRPDKPQVWIHPERRMLVCSNAQASPYFDDQQAFIESLFGELYGLFDTGPTETRVPDSAEFQITLSLLVGQNAEGDARQLTWEAQEAARKHLLPLVGMLQNIADFRVHYQVKSHVEMTGVRPIRQDDGTFIVEEDQLPVFVDDNRWNIAGSTVSAPAINLVLFVPPANVQPLKIASFKSGQMMEQMKPVERMEQMDQQQHQHQQHQDQQQHQQQHQSQSQHQPQQHQSQQHQDQQQHYFGYKQWGGVYILNHQDGDTIGAKELAPILAAFVGQLRRLFGVGLPVADRRAEGLEFDWILPESRRTGMSAVELDALICWTLRDRVASARRTLQALQRLLAQYTEIAVLPAVGDLVARSLEGLRSAERNLAKGRWREATLAASRATQWCDAAFFHPTMMAHQYFPQEHKLGVYMPLFFPFVLPIAVATLALAAAWLKEKRLSRAAKAKSE